MANSIWHFSLLALFSLAMVGCEREAARSATATAFEEMQRLYEEARQRAPEDAVNWAREDLARAGDWQYRVLVLPVADPQSLELQLNELGTERWEVFWVERAASGLTLFLKRPAVSYLKSVPLSGLSEPVDPE